MGRKRIEIAGLVQGVGFRPFVYRLARQLDLGGFVLNSSGGVVIEAEGSESSVGEFLGRLRSELPPLARIDTMRMLDATALGDRVFSILDSVDERGRFAMVPSDVATCADCLADIASPTNRRHAYPFTNCTNCGPRYTIISAVPYDRVHTTMDAFPMCPDCVTEYRDPANRRFHAEPNACPACGPSLSLDDEPEHALERTKRLLSEGEIVAIKGLGGFHLACDARNAVAVALLRERKRKSAKAFAIMVRDLAVAETLCHVTPAQRDLLTGFRSPIVLLDRRADVPLPRDVAPGNTRLGVMLPYTPLHHLLFDDVLDALVMTSGNVSEEPIVSRNEDARPRLHSLAHHFLMHNRPIQTRVDDSVLQVFEDREYPVRRSRGYAPDPIDLGRPLHEVLACGGELKNTFCLTKARYAILSPHIGDLENMETMDFFRDTMDHLRRFFRAVPSVVAHDLHPQYLSTRFALEESGLPAIGIQHHHAHIASCMADNGIDGSVIGVAFDGTGFGTDGKIWGGEFLVCGFRQFERCGHLRYTALAGGDTAVRQPWRSALAYLRDAFGTDAGPIESLLLAGVPELHRTVVRRMIERNLQTVETSSCGRLFDAVSSMLGICHQATYEGQAAIELEMAASDDQETYPFTLSGDSKFELDLRSAIQAIVTDKRAGTDVPAISARFHRTLANAVVAGCERIRQSSGYQRVCLSGGTFHNLRLLSLAVSGLRANGFEVFLHHRVPANDGGLSLGQALIASAQLD